MSCELILSDLLGIQTAGITAHTSTCTHYSEEGLDRHAKGTYQIPDLHSSAWLHALGFEKVLTSVTVALVAPQRHI